MVLLSKVKYETNIKELKDISSDSILSMLKDVKADIRRVDDSFTDVNLVRVLAIIEKGKYLVNGSVITIIDLSSAKNVVEAYRRYSEGGCQSCINLGRETIDAQDASPGLYCRVNDPDYDANALGYRSRVSYSGFSPKVRKHHNLPCDDWKPRFLPKLEELISKKISESVPKY
jgi:ribosomal protein L18E